jgi:hypothetical protein
MPIAALSALHPEVAAAASDGGCALTVSAYTPNQAGQLAPAATHPTPPVSGTWSSCDFGARLLHLVGDNTLGVSRGSGLAANAAVDRKAPPTTKRSSAISAVAPLPPATSIPPPSTWVRENVATSVPTGNIGTLRL